MTGSEIVNYTTPIIEVNVAQKGDFMEENNKSWFENTKEKFLGFCAKHPDILLTIVGGTFTLAGAFLNYRASKNEYTENVYMTDGTNVFKVPAKSMNSKKLTTVN